MTFTNYTILDHLEQMQGKWLETESEIIEDVIYRLNKHPELASKSRKRPYVDQRSFLMNILRTHTRMPLIKIGRLFNRDHATVLWNVKRHKIFIESKDYDYTINTKKLSQTYKKILL